MYELGYYGTMIAIVYIIGRLIWDGISKRK